MLVIKSPKFNKFRYTFQILNSSIPFSPKFFTQLTSNNPNPNEHHILNQLSQLLPIRHQINSSISNPSSNTPPNISLLSPEEKLRGVFIQNLTGKTLIKRALTAVSVDGNVNIDCDLISKVLNRGNLDGESMVTVFEWARESGNVIENVDSYNVVFKALGRRKFFGFMLSLLGEMRKRGLRGDYETLFVFVDSFVKAKRVSKGLDVFWKLDEFGMEYDLECLKVVVRCLCQRGYVGSASSLLSKMKMKTEKEKEKEGRVFDGETYNIVIRGWCKLGRVSEIEKVLIEMVEDGFEPDSLTFSYLLEGLGRGGDIGGAVKIFENLKEEKRCRLNLDIFNAMIFNFLSIGKIDEGLKYYESMLSDNCEPNSDTFVQIIFAFLKARRVADAIEMFDEMLKRGILPATGIVTSFIEILCSYGPPHAAMMIYKKAKDAKCTISVNAYKILLMRLSRFGKCGMLLNVWDEMGKSGFVSDVEVYEYIINGLCNNGQLENAVVVMEDCLKKGFCPSGLICAKLNNKLMDLNKVEIAYKLFLKIKKSRRDENAKRYWRAKGWHF